MQIMTNFFARSPDIKIQRACVQPNMPVGLIELLAASDLERWAVV
jgi:hypothetical protein